MFTGKYRSLPKSGSLEPSLMLEKGRSLPKQSAFQVDSLAVPENIKQGW